MNIELLESFGQNYPEEFDGLLDCVSLSVTCAFNRRGTLLAVGCNDGRIAIWDFLTRGIAKIITAHVHPVSSLSFSRRGRTLVSSSTDNTVCVFDVLTSEVIAKWRFSTPVLKVQFNPRNENLILVVPMKHAALIVHLPNSGAAASADKSHKKETRNKTHTILPLDESDPDLNLTASYDRRGEFVFTGNAKGRIAVINVGSGSIAGPEIVASFRVSSTAIKQIEFAPKRKDVFLVNTADRVIRVYEYQEVLTCGIGGEPEPVQKLQDLVNKTTWKKCCFAGGPDAEYVCAGSSRSHSIYVWERSVGTLVKILHGTKGETLLDVVWHPIRPIICSISSGVVSVWAQPQVENWSAFAPDFKEMDENVEYEERESEFDQEDEDRSPSRVHDDDEGRFGTKSCSNNGTNGDNPHEDDAVDVMSVQPTACYISSDEEAEDVEKNDLIYLPVTLEIDEPENSDVPAFNPLAQTVTSVTVHPDSIPDPVTSSSNDHVIDIKLDIDSGAIISAIGVGEGVAAAAGQRSAGKKTEPQSIASSSRGKAAGLVSASGKRPSTSAEYGSGSAGKRKK